MLLCAVDRAFLKLCQKEPRAHLFPWQKAEKVLENFSVPELGEELAARFLCDVVTEIRFPNDRISYENVLHAENLLAEVLGINPDHELHMDEVEIIQRQFRDGESLEQVKVHFVANQIKKPLF